MIVYSCGLVLSIVRGSLPSGPTKCSHRLGATSGFGGCGFDWNGRRKVLDRGGPERDVGSCVRGIELE